VIDLLAAAVNAQTLVLDSSVTAAIVDTLAVLTANLTTSQAVDVLRLSVDLLNKTGGVDESTGSLLLDSATVALGGRSRYLCMLGHNVQSYTLNINMYHAMRAASAASGATAPRTSYQEIVQRLTSIAATQVAPGTSPFTFMSPRTGEAFISVISHPFCGLKTLWPCTALRVYVLYVSPFRPHVVTLEPSSKATFLLPASLLAALSPRLCGSLLLIKATHLGTGTAARLLFNSSEPLLSNMTMLELGTICDGGVVMVRLLMVLLAALPGI
jgi:hypothetical protein